MNKRLIRLVPLVLLGANLQLKIRDIRNEPDVRKWMYTDHLIDVDEHWRWIERLGRDDKQIVFAILDPQPLGVVSVNALDRLHKKADWAYYLTETARGGLGSALEYSFVDFVFSSLGLEKLNCEVIEGNDAVVKLHKKFLFEEEGFRRSQIFKDGKRLGVHFLGLTKEAWQAGKGEIYNKYKAVFEKFSISIELETSKSAPENDDFAKDAQHGKEFWDKLPQTQ